MKSKIDSLNSSKVPIIAFDKELEKLQDKILFSQKLEKANDILMKIGLPNKEKLDTTRYKNNKD